MRIGLAALFCAFLAGAVRAQDRDVADVVRAAFTANDTAALRALAARDDLDPWEHPYYWAAWQLWGLPD